MVVAEIGGCKKWALQREGVASYAVTVCGVAAYGGCGVWGLFLFFVFAYLTLEFCYNFANEPGTLRIVLKEAHLR